MRIIPLDDRVLVKPLEEKQSKSIILIPQGARKPPTTGTVIEIGNEMEGILAVNDVVMYGQYGGEQVDIDGQSFLLISRSDILAKVAE